MRGVNLTLERESMLIYKSFIDVSENLNDKDYRRFWDAIHKFGIYGSSIPKFDDPVLDALMTLIMPIIKANIKNYENGMKGGAPKGNSNAKKTTQKQPGVNSGLNKKTTQKQGNVTVTDTDTDTDNSNDTATDTVTDTVNVKKEKNPFVNYEEDYITDIKKYTEWNKAHGIEEDV